MAHELVINEDGIASMSYTGLKPWHGLGQQLTDGAPIETWIKESGMDFEVSRAPVLFKIGDNPKSKNFTVPNKEVLFRDDDKTPLAVVSKRYNIVQPREVLNFFKDLTEEHGFSLETAGVMFHGAKYWALAKTPYSLTLPGNDVIKAYLLLATACDGSMSTIARYVSQRVVCSNTLELALAERSPSIRVNHKTKYSEKRIKQELGLLDEAWDAHSGQVEKMARTSVKTDAAVQYLIKLLGNPEQPLEKQAKAQSIAKVMDLFLKDGIGARTVSANDTVWGLLNSVTEYVDHHRGSTVDDLMVDRRMDNAWFYDGAALKKRAYSEALLLAA